MVSKQYTELFVLMLEGKVLTPQVFEKYWTNYRNNQLHGWRPPKKVYYTLSQAKNGLRYVPELIKDKVEIHRFQSIGKVPLDKS